MLFNSRITNILTGSSTLSLAVGLSTIHLLDLSSFLTIINFDTAKIDLLSEQSKFAIAELSLILDVNAVVQAIWRTLKRLVLRHSICMSIVAAIFSTSRA